MRGSYIAFFLILSIAGAGIWFYSNFYKKDVDVWQLVPGNAIMVYESKGIVNTWNNVSGKDFWETARLIPDFSRIEHSFLMLDSMSGKTGKLDKLTRNHPFLCSFHAISADAFGFIFYLDLSGDDSKEILNAIVSSFGDLYNVQTRSRNYQGIEIYEAKQKNSQQAFSWFVYGDAVVGSYTPFLIEDVIRNISDRYRDNFSSKIRSLDNINKLVNDDGDLYINFREIPKLLNLFVDPFTARELQPLSRFANAVYFDLKTTDNEILLNGASTVSSGSERDYISIFHNQSARYIELSGILPQRTAALYHLTFSNYSSWQSNLLKYWAENDSIQFNRFINFDTSQELLLDWIDGEIGLSILESISLSDPDKLLFVKAAAPEKAFNQLKSFTSTYNLSMGDSLYYEDFGDFEIVQLNYPEFPATLFGKAFHGFENSYFTQIGQYIVLGNSMQVVKRLFEDIENENTWGKSVRHNLFLENTLGEASLSYMINIPRVWNILMEKIKPEWITFFNTYENQFKSFDLMAFQMSNFDNRFYTSMALTHQKGVYQGNIASRFSRVQNNFLNATIVTRPFIVRSHISGKMEVLLQDAEFMLNLISDQGEIVWSAPVGDKIVSDIKQIDFYKNGKLQYIFATKNKLHIVDRNGDIVENYPLSMPQNREIAHFSVVDYDNSKRYRFFVADTKGHLFLFDKEKQNLEGWQPRELQQALSAAPIHIRVRGGDCMLALQTDGVLNVMNRRGEMYPGFPVEIKSPVSGEFFVETGNNFESTKIHVVSDEGEMVQVNLRGKILKREQLIRPTKESTFRLVPDAMNLTYVIVRQEYNKLSVLDRNGSLKFEQNFLSSGDLHLQYYRLGTANDIFAITDQQQEFTYLFDNTGELINFEPLESGFPVAIMYFSRNNDYQVYKCYQNSFSVMSFNKQ
ncbi:MAG: hypothetical protein JJU28_02580 [Cyclobacteriaceae bacterium]|nr:hypothetical protein [Cyclobacteriaceae bacterium]